MIKVVQAYLLIRDNKPRMVITDKSIIKNAKDEELKKISLAIHTQQIKGWNKEIEVLEGQ